ncbi:MAG: hypothetical protein EA352_00290 [Gemmatimonadales bacterium]|nr:MAG: hypothetical protein EA352_00290 [Gemmatimonadales bacterium]
MSWPDPPTGEVHVDGRPAFPDELEFLSADDVEGVEYYRSPMDAPMGLNIDPLAGMNTPVIVIWTRRPGRDRMQPPPDPGQYR